MNNPNLQRILAGILRTDFQYILANMYKSQRFVVPCTRHLLRKGKADKELVFQQVVRRLKRIKFHVRKSWAMDYWIRIKIGKTGNKLMRKIIHCCAHCVNGSPVWPTGQTHIGVWLITWQLAFDPQDPGHGSLHFWLIQARWLEHSLLLTHSGLHCGGEPVNSGKHEQDGESLITWHCALGPQGDGWHGLTCSTGFVA